MPTVDNMITNSNDFRGLPGQVNEESKPCDVPVIVMHGHLSRGLASGRQQGTVRTVTNWARIGTVEKRQPIVSHQICAM